MKKISVIIPAYNMADLTVKTVDSVLGQTYKNIEIIVVDDGSTDDTREKLQAYGSRIRYVYKENGGACSARNLGISLAKGGYIAFLDCDDIYLPKKIELSVDFLERNTDFGFVYSAAYYIDENENILRKFSNCKSRYTGWIAKRLVLKNYICNSTVVARKSCFEKVGLFDESIFTPADWDMWLRIAEQYKIGYLEEPFTLYRISNNYILKNIELFKKEELVVLKKAFQRNKQLTKRFQNKLISNACCRCGVNYILIGNFVKAKDELIGAIAKYKFNVVAILLLIYLIIAPKNLCLLVRKKVYYNLGLGNV